MSKYTPAAVRKLLEQTLRTDADFMQFCRENFPNVAGRFSDGMDRVAKQNLLFTLVGDADILFDKLCSQTGINQSDDERDQSPVQSVPHNVATRGLSGVLAIVVLAGASILIFKFAVLKQTDPAADLAFGAVSVPLPRPIPERPLADLSAIQNTQPPSGRNTPPVKMPKPNGSLRPCEPGFQYYSDLAGQGLSPCVQLPRVTSASNCSCDIGAVGKQCLLSGFSDVIGKKRLGGMEEQIRAEYRERGIDLCQAKLKGCRQTKDVSERHVCYCCPEQ